MHEAVGWLEEGRSGCVVVVWLGRRGVVAEVVGAVAEVVVRLREVCVGAVSQRCPLAIPGISAGIRSRACRWRSILRRRDEFRARRPSPRGGTRFRGGPSWRAAPSRPRACLRAAGRRLLVIAVIVCGVVAVCPGRGFHASSQLCARISSTGSPSGVRLFGVFSFIRVNKPWGGCLICRKDGWVPAAARAGSSGLGSRHGAHGVSMSPGIPTRLLATQSDERLLALVRDGHERAFEALVHRYRKPLLGYCRRLRLSDARAEDIVQLALLKTWIAVREGAEVRDLKAWLYRVVHNTAVNALRDSAHEGEPFADPAHALEAHPPHQPGEDSQLDRGLAMRETLAEVAALPPLQREVIVRTAVAGHSHEQVAADLGITNGAVRGLLYRARTTLRTAVTVLTPPQLLGWLAGRSDQGGPAPERLAELAGGGGAVGVGGAAGIGGLLLKGGAVALTVGTVITGAAVVHLSASTHRRNPRRLIASAAPTRGAGMGSTVGSTVGSTAAGAIWGRAPADSPTSPVRAAAAPGAMPGVARGPRAPTLAGRPMLPVGASPVLLRLPAASARRDPRRGSPAAGTTMLRGRRRLRRVPRPAQPRGPGKPRGPARARGRAAARVRAANRARDRAGPWVPPPATAPRVAPTRVALREALRVAHLKVAHPAVASRARGPAGARAPRRALGRLRLAARAQGPRAPVARKARATVAHRAGRAAPARNPRAANPARWWGRSCTKSATSSNTCCTDGSARSERSRRPRRSCPWLSLATGVSFACGSASQRTYRLKETAGWVTARRRESGGGDAALRRRASAAAGRAGWPPTPA